MRIQKISFILAFIVSVVSLFLAGMNHQSDNFFSTQLFIGITSSSLIITIISLSNYFMERKKAIKHFYTLLVKDLNVINRYTNENDLKSQLEDLIAISNIDMIELELALEEIDFMNKKENSYLKDHVYEPINDLHHEIIRYKELIIAQYKLNEHSDDLDKFLNEMDEAMLEVVEEAKMREIGNRFYTFKENNVKNIFTYQILDDFEKYVKYFSK